MANRSATLVATIVMLLTEPAVFAQHRLSLDEADCAAGDNTCAVSTYFGHKGHDYSGGSDPDLLYDPNHTGMAGGDKPIR